MVRPLEEEPCSYLLLLLPINSASQLSAPVTGAEWPHRCSTSWRCQCPSPRVVHHEQAVDRSEAGETIFLPGRERELDVDAPLHRQGAPAIAQPVEGVRREVNPERDRHAPCGCGGHRVRWLAAAY
jgi:hypothetical protein